MASYDALAPIVEHRALAPAVLHYVQCEACPSTTVTAWDTQIYTAPAATPLQVTIIAPAPAVVLPNQVNTAATVCQQGTVTSTAAAPVTTVTTMTLLE